jgi:excisionase family DNA binding protein
MNTTQSSTTMAMTGLDRLLNIEELSQYLGIPVTTLRDWRVDGVGPKAVKLGRAIRYPESRVRDWIEEQLDG